MARRRALTVRALRAGGAAYLGQAAGRSWEHGRYQGPYLRDTLMGMGAMVETLETSHTWSRLGELHERGRRGDPRRARGPGNAGPRLLPPLARLRRRRLALLHLHLPRPPRRRDRAVGRGQARRLRGDRRPRRHDHPPPRGRPRPRPLHGGRGGGGRPRGPARGQGAARPDRDHEPRQAALLLSARAAAICLVGRRFRAARIVARALSWLLSPVSFPFFFVYSHSAVRGRRMLPASLGRLSRAEHCHAPHWRPCRLSWFYVSRFSAIACAWRRRRSGR